MLAGRFDVNYLLLNYRTAAYKQFRNKGDPAMQLSAPQTSMEASSTAGQRPPVSLTVSSDPGAGSGETEFSITLAGWKAALSAAQNSSNSPLSANPVRLKLSSAASAPLQASVLISLAHNAPVNFTVNSSDYGSAERASRLAFKSECKGANDFSENTYTCPGSGLNITNTCAGAEGTMTSYCPVSAPACQLSSLTSGGEIECRVAAYDADSTTCLCNVTAPGFQRAAAHAAAGAALEACPARGELDRNGSRVNLDLHR